MRYAATQLGSSTYGMEPDQDRLVIADRDLREARLATDLAGFGLSDEVICTTLRISPRTLTLRLFQYQATASQGGQRPFPCLEHWHAQPKSRVAVP